MHLDNVARIDGLLNAGRRSTSAVGSGLIAVISEGNSSKNCGERDMDSENVM